MPSGESIVLRSVERDEMRQFFTDVIRAFGEWLQDDDYDAEMLTAEPERTIAAFDGDAIVGTAGAFTFDFAVPGGWLPAAGVTYVGVDPTHRRRGLLSSMMRHQLDDVRRREEPIAVLWASESVIYGRYGYGIATWKHGIEIDRVDARLRADLPGDDRLRLRMVDIAEARRVMTTIETALPHRPGRFRRNDAWIESLTVDTAWRRSGASPLQTVVAYLDETPVGYAAYRTKASSLSPHGLFDGDVRVVEQQALSPAANVALTRHLLSLDLMRHVRWWNLPTDTSLPHLLTDSRQARTTLLDAVHLRVVDVARTLTGRTYAAPLDVVLDLTDPIIDDNTGRWHLVADTDGASCQRTDAAADVTLDMQTLGAIYLGGTSLHALAEAGRVTASHDVIRRTGHAFGGEPNPWCPMIF